MPRTDATPKPYHHGHLKQALVDAAETLLVEQGIDKLSLRAVARCIGVSQTAPYAHFADRQALLAAVAARGFECLTGCLREAERNKAADLPLTQRLARAYVAFALEHPMRFRLMFGAALGSTGDAALQAARAASYVPIREAVARRAEDAGAGPWADDASLAAWALVHGLATLILDGGQPWPRDAAARDALVDSVVSVYSIEAMADRRRA